MDASKTLFLKPVLSESGNTNLESNYPRPDIEAPRESRFDRTLKVGGWVAGVFLFLLIALPVILYFKVKTDSDQRYRNAKTKFIRQFDDYQASARRALRYPDAPEVKDDPLRPVVLKDSKGRRSVSFRGSCGVMNPCLVLVHTENGNFPDPKLTHNYGISVSKTTKFRDKWFFVEGGT